MIVIGGGHNGLVSAAYLARAGRKVLVLERRHVLGGAAVTEEIYPGFKYSVCSYVVSLLRPEIIRELDLPRHGLEILPLDGTFTPMPDGDYLWRVNDHAKTRREIARHSKVDAEAYEEYGKAMIEMGRFVKPILNMTPPDPTSLNPRGLMDLAFLGRRFQALSEVGCKIDFRLHYTFSNKVLEKLIGPVFDHIAGTLVERFVQRAETLCAASSR